MEEKQVNCPICSKKFSVTAIEQHASKCLFLSESNQQETSKHYKEPSPQNKAFFVKSSGSKFIKPTTSKRKILSPVRSEEQTRKAVEIKKENDSKKPRINNHVPLAERMRPTTISRYIGQDHVLGPRAMLSQLLQKGEIPNIILWGPPGCGKTSLANVISQVCKYNSNGKMKFVKLSAAMVGVREVKEVINIASNELKFGRRTVVFLDEIHRFNKSQQDVLLPHIESGTIILIGATTENPSFNLNSALLSRCRLLVLEKLSIENLKEILKNAIISLNGILHVTSHSNKEANTVLSESSSEIPKFLIDEQTIEWLAETCDGDARIALGGLELAVQSNLPTEAEFLQTGPIIITLDDIKENLKKSHMLYDRKGDQHYDTISALHKAVRASDENAALYWLTRMISGGEDPMYIARRLVRMASEDIGLEDPKALGIAVHTMNACKMIGLPECDVILAQCTVYLAKAPKSRLIEDALRAAQRTVTEWKGAQPNVPLHLRCSDALTKAMKKLGHVKEYNMMHKDISGLNYLPEGMENINFFETDWNDVE
ncbi:ATPase WRNIP1-like [Prorops nasuta]|uniref:ATPase WRNIP1-like n=1 Tax=Prorops nasuta TaxID=863751 RepID=UPI0034CE1D2E